MPFVAPRQASSPPRVTIKAGMPAYAVNAPCNAPINAPTAIPANSDGNSPQCSEVCTRTAAMPVIPTSDPTERSICPARITITMPTARMPVTAVWRIRFEKFRGSRKTPSVTIVKMIQTPIRANTRP